MVITNLVYIVVVVVVVVVIVVCQQACLHATMVTVMLMCVHTARDHHYTKWSNTKVDRTIK